MSSSGPGGSSWRAVLLTASSSTTRRQPFTTAPFVFVDPPSGGGHRRLSGHSHDVGAFPTPVARRWVELAGALDHHHRAGDHHPGAGRLAPPHRPAGLTG